MIEQKKIEHGEIGRSVKIISKEKSIIKYPILCGDNDCKNELTNEEIEEYKKLIGKIRREDMLCEDCRRKWNVNKIR